MKLGSPTSVCTFGFMFAKIAHEKLSRSAAEVFELGFKIFPYPCRSECVYSSYIVLLVAYSMAYSQNMKNLEINEFVPSSLFIRPGLLTLKQHYDRGAKRRKLLGKRSEGEKDLGMVTRLFHCKNIVLTRLPVVPGSEKQL